MKTARLLAIWLLVLGLAGSAGAHVVVVGWPECPLEIPDMDCIEVSKTLSDLPPGVITDVRCSV